MEWRKMLFILSQTWEKVKKKSDPLRSIELQTFGFRAPMFLHWAAENSLVKARPSQGPHMTRVAWFTLLFFCSSRWSLVVTFYLYQGSKLTLANSHNAIDFDNLLVRKISTSKRLLFRIMYVSQTCSRKVVAVKTTAKETKYLIPFLINFSAH